MSTITKILIGVAAFFVISMLSTIGYVISTNNTCVRMETTIKAQYKQNQNNYDNYFKTLQEVAQVPKMYMNDLKSLWHDTMTGRYGSNGSRATWQWIQEHNPSIDSKMYSKIQTIIEAGRKDFEENQKMLLDKKRVYEMYVGQFPTKLIASSFGYPSKEIADMDIVTSDETETAFKTKKADPIKIGN